MNIKLIYPPNANNEAEIYKNIAIQMHYPLPMDQERRIISGIVCLIAGSIMFGVGIEMLLILVKAYIEEPLSSSQNIVTNLPILILLLISIIFAIFGAVYLRRSFLLATRYQTFIHKKYTELINNGVTITGQIDYVSSSQQEKVRNLHYYELPTKIVYHFRSPQNKLLRRAYYTRAKIDFEPGNTVQVMFLNKTISILL